MRDPHFEKQIPNTNINNKKRKTNFSKFKYALSQISHNNGSLVFPPQDLTLGRNKNKKIDEVFEENKILKLPTNFLMNESSFNDYSKKNELSELRQFKTNNNSFDLQTNSKKIDVISLNLEKENNQLKQENDELKQNLEEFRLIFDLKNKFIKKLEENLKKTKQKLSILEELTDQLKFELQYFQKKPKNFDSIRSLKINKKTSYFPEDEVKDHEIELFSSQKKQNIDLNQTIKEENLISCWFAQNKPFKYFMPKLTLNLNKRFIVEGHKVSILSINCSFKNNACENFEEITIKIESSPSKISIGFLFIIMFRYCFK